MAGKETTDHRLVIGAVLGSSGVDGAAEESLAATLERVSGFVPELLDEYHDLLVGAIASGHESVDLAECVVVLGLANPKLAQVRGLDVPGYAAWAAREHVREGRPDRAVDLISLATRQGQRSPELSRIEQAARASDRSRRRARDQELLNARRCISGDRIEQARHHLLRTLEIDPQCAEAASMLSGLDARDTRRERNSAAVRVAFFGLLALGLPIGGVSIAQVRASQQYREFARPVAADLLAIERRIGELAEFSSDHPLWWGQGTLAQEVSILTTQRDALEQQLREQNEMAELDRLDATNRVEACYLAARTAVEAGHPEAALAMLEDALEGGVPSATQRARLRRDIAAIRELLAEESAIVQVDEGSRP